MENVLSHLDARGLESLTRVSRELKRWAEPAFRKRLERFWRNGRISNEHVAKKDFGHNFKNALLLTGYEYTFVQRVLVDSDVAVIVTQSTHHKGDKDVITIHVYDLNADVKLGSVMQTPVPTSSLASRFVYALDDKIASNAEFVVIGEARKFSVYSKRPFKVVKTRSKRALVGVTCSSSRIVAIYNKKGGKDAVADVYAFEASPQVLKKVGSFAFECAFYDFSFKFGSDARVAFAIDDVKESECRLNVFDPEKLSKSWPQDVTFSSCIDKQKSVHCCGKYAEIDFYGDTILFIRTHPENQPQDLLSIFGLDSAVRIVTLVDANSGDQIKSVDVRGQYSSSMSLGLCRVVEKIVMRYSNWFFYRDAIKGLTTFRIQDPVKTNGLVPLPTSTAILYGRYKVDLKDQKGPVFRTQMVDLDKENYATEDPLTCGSPWILPDGSGFMEIILQYSDTYYLKLTKFDY